MEPLWRRLLVLRVLMLTGSAIAQDMRMRSEDNWQGTEMRRRGNPLPQTRQMPGRGQMPGRMDQQRMAQMRGTMPSDWKVPHGQPGQKGPLPIGFTPLKWAQKAGKPQFGQARERPVPPAPTPFPLPRVAHGQPVETRWETPEFEPPAPTPYPTTIPPPRADFEPPAPPPFPPRVDSRGFRPPHPAPPPPRPLPTRPPPQSWTTVTTTKAYNPDLPALIIIPPLTGSVLEADIDRSKLKNPLCKLPFPKKLWPPGGTTVLSGMLECFQEEMSLLVDAQASRAKQTEVVHEPPGVHIHTTAYGDVHKSQQPGTWEMTLEQLHLLGYKEGKNMFAAPFDWRHGPADWKNRDWPRLKDAVEGWVSDVNGRPAILISLSMGASYLQAFLLHADGVDAAWKRKHVAGFVSMSGVYGGTLSAMAGVLWGNPFPVGKPEGPGVGFFANMGQDIVKKKGMDYAKALLRGFGSIVWLAPPPKKQGNEARTLITLPPAWGGNITDELLARFLADEGYPEGLSALYELAYRFPAESHPGVHVVCMYGTDVPSPSFFSYSGDQSKDSDDVQKKAVELAAQKLRGAGIENEKIREGMQDILGDVVDMVRGPETTTPAPPIPEGPPKGAKVGDAAWMTSAAQFVQARIPDAMAKIPGDGIVEHESLAMCDNWKGMPGVKDVKVMRYRGFRHAQEVRDRRAQLDFRAVIADLAGVRNPDNRTGGSFRPRAVSQFCEEKAPGRDCPEFDFESCAVMAMRGQMQQGDRCCAATNAWARCAGRCAHQFVVQAIMDGQQEMVSAFHQACNFEWFPSQMQLRLERQQAMRQIEMWERRHQMEQMEKRSADDEDDEAPVSEKCIAKAMGMCPKFRDIGACNRKAITGQLWRRDSCCREMEIVAACLGKGCLAGGIFTMLAVNQDKTKGLMTLAKWQQGCPNVKFPSPADLQKVAHQATDLTEKAAQVKEVAQDFIKKKGIADWFKSFRGGQKQDDDDSIEDDSEDDDDEDDDEEDGDEEDGEDGDEEVVDDSEDEESPHKMNPTVKKIVSSLGESRKAPKGLAGKMAGGNAIEQLFKHKKHKSRPMILMGVAAGMATFILLSVVALFSFAPSRRYIFKMCKRKGRRVVLAQQDVALQPASESNAQVPEEALLPQSNYDEGAEVYQALQSPRS